MIVASEYVNALYLLPIQQQLHKMHWAYTDLGGWTR